MTFPVERGLAKTFAGHIHWRAAGSGPAVMISHINQQSSAMMLELLQALALDFRAVAIDYPGHGHSDPFDGQPTIDDYERSVVEVMDALGIERAAAMGWIDPQVLREGVAREILDHQQQLRLFAPGGGVAVWSNP